MNFNKSVTAKNCKNSAIFGLCDYSAIMTLSVATYSMQMLQTTRLAIQVAFPASMGRQAKLPSYDTFNEQWTMAVPISCESIKTLFWRPETRTSTLMTPDTWYIEPSNNRTILLHWMSSLSPCTNEQFNRAFRSDPLIISR